MEVLYEVGKLIPEPVSCPDGTHLKMKWWNGYDSETGEDIPGVRFNRGPDPKVFLGPGAWYSLDELRRLGRGDIQAGINVVGQVWYRTPYHKLMRGTRLLNEEIEAVQ